MSKLALFTEILIAFGGLLMILATLRAKRLLKKIPDQQYEKKWKLLISLMYVFIAGYFASMYFVYRGERESVLALTGIVYFLGATFVFLVVNVSYRTINDLSKSVNQLKTEVTSRVSTEGELQVSKSELRGSISLLQAALESTADGILIVDRKGKMTGLNKKFLEMWNIPQSIIESGDDQKALEFVLEQLINSDAFLKKVEYLYEHPDEEGLDTLEFKDGRIFERYSKPQVLDEEIVGRVWSFRDVTQQRKTQQALEELNAQLEERVRAQTAELQDLYDHAPAAYHTLDSEGRIMRINDTELKWLGYSRTEMEGKHFSDFLNEESKKVFFDVFPKMKRAAGLKDFEMTFVKKDGNSVTGLISAQTITDDKGKFVKSRSIVIDITEKKKLEIELRETERTYRTMIETAGDVMYTANEKGIFTYINPRCKELTGYERQELVGKHYLEVIAPEWKEKVRAFYRNQNADHVNKSLFSFQIITKNGERKWVEQTAIQLGDNGNLKGYQSIVRDITARIKTEEELRMSEERYRSLAENAPVLILVAERNGKITYINRIPRTIPESKVMGESVFSFILPEFQERFRQKFETAFMDGNPQQMEIKAIRPDNQLIWFSTMIAPVKKDSETESAIIISLDITERKRSEEEIEILNKELNIKVSELEAANQDLESFTYSVSHDLRAPLRAINGFASIVRDQYQDKFDEEGMRNMNLILSSAMGMAQLIDDLLAFSRLGRKELSKTEVNMEKVVEDVIREVDAGHWNVNAQIRADNILPVNGDRTLLHQVLFNLVNNALKFSHLKDRPVVEIGSYHKEGENIYYVKDNGVGFDMNLYDKLFKVFSRLHNPADFEGSGVGLAIVQRIVSKHGGRVWAEGKINEGATFYFSLPAAKRESIFTNHKQKVTHIPAEEEVPGE